MLHVILLEDLNKGHKDYVRRDPRTGKLEHVQESNSRPAYLPPADIVKMVVDSHKGDREKAADFILHTMAHGLAYEERKKKIESFAKHLYPDLPEPDAKKKLLKRARQLAILAKSLLGSDFPETHALGMFL